MESMTTAIVIGGSIAGFSAAAALAAAIDRIILVEKDDLTGVDFAEESIQETRRRRRGVPQYTEPHVLLAGGAAAFDDLVPGITQKVLSRGALPYDPGRGLKLYDFGGDFPRNVPCGMQVISTSRRLLNGTLQEMVQRQVGDKLIIRDKTKVAGLLWDNTPNPGRKKMVRGIVLDSGEEILADLVVVCDGRRSQLPHWLKEGGINLPSRLKVDAQFSWAACWMKLPDDFDPEKEYYATVCNGRPAMRRSGMALILENGLCQVSVAGFEGERPPSDREGWLAYAKSLPQPDVYELASRAEALTPIVPFSGAPNLSYQFHRAKLPAGLVVLGDACQAVNPVYGQGMSIAARNALVLRRQVTKAVSGKKSLESKRGALAAMGPKFQKKLAATSAIAWSLATNEDMRWKGVIVEGVTRPPRLMYRYLDSLLLAAQRDGKVWSTMIRIMQFVDPPSRLFAPHMVAAAFRRRPKAKIQPFSGQDASSGRAIE